MRFVGALFLLAISALFAGCGYVHFGRQPERALGAGDASLATAHSNLVTEHKILKQELALVRKQGDALRDALERGAANAVSASGTDLAGQLAETSREVAALRASNAKLRAEMSAAVPSNPAGSPADEKLAAALRNAIQLEEENVRLRQELERTRGENVSLAEKLKSSIAQNQQSQSALSQLNLDLLAEKQARARAEQIAEAVRTQLTAVIAQSASSTATAAAGTPTTATGLGALQSAKAPPAGSSATAELRTNVEALQTAQPGAPKAPSGGSRTHTVQPGDTLQQLARIYYGTPERWSAIYEANTAELAGGQSLRAGMVLQIPE